MRDRIQELMSQLASTDEKISVAAARQLLEGGGDSVVALCALFCDGPTTSLSSRALDSLKKLGPDAVEPLVRVLKSGSPEEQVYAIVGLKMLCEPCSLQPLLEALESPHPQVRQAAIGGLRMLRDKRAVEPLIRRLQDDREVAAAAAWTLGWLEDRRAVAPLLALLGNRDWRLRQAAAFALGQIGDEEALDAIRSHLGDSKPQVRKTVKRALANFHWRKTRRLG
jgi:HEAT repeat protein